MKQDLLEAMLADAGIAAQVGAAVSWGERARNGPAKSITLALLDRQPGYTHQGDDGLPEAYVLADCWGETPEDADDIANTVRAFCGRAKASTTNGRLQGVFIDSARDIFEGESPERIHRTALTLQVWRPDP